MFGFDPLTLSAGFILASMSSAECPVQGAFDVDVQFVQKDSPPITDLTSEQLTQKFSSDHDASMATDGNWMKSGSTLVSGTAMKEAVDVAFKVHDVSPGKACLSVSKVNYTITYSPATYIGSDVAAGCRYDVTVAHLKRHIDLDTQVINDGVPVMREALENYVSSMGAQGPFAASEVESQKIIIMRQIIDGISPQWKKLSFQRQNAQKTIDTAEDYKRDTASCPGDFPNPESAK
ncbi:MAG: hypothetical protein EPN97_07890 [Alphaproteobacteria bacterium]|nr:MAG: hypothetical protein EPN97_07890 [Alphaproteobacteria bacterium]